MSYTTPRPVPVDITKLVELLEAARDTVALDVDAHHYPRQHSERSAIDDVFDDLVDWARGQMAPADLRALASSASDPDLQPGDLTLINGIPATVRQIRFCEPGKHRDSGLPSHQAAIEVVTARGSQWMALVPHPVLAR